MYATHFLIVLLAVMSVAGSMAGAALLTRPEGPTATAAVPGARPAGTPSQPDQATILARVEALQERLLQDPQDGEGWKMLGRSMMALGRPLDAVAAYSRAAQLMPGDTEVRGALAQLEEIARQSRAHDTERPQGGAAGGQN